MLPHTVSFFARNPQFDIEPVFCVVEQADTVQFNRGALKNHGYLEIESEVDYVCFHDVDYLPIWADYSMPDCPSRIIWWGLHRRPMGHNTNHVITAQRHGLAAVAVMQKSHFEQANGYSNQYWGWGFEDTDLADRMTRQGLNIGYRDGTFQGLDHDNQGYLGLNRLSPDHVINQELYERKKQWPNDQADGIRQPVGQVTLKERRVAQGLEPGEQADLWWIRVDLGQVDRETQ